MTSPPEPRTFDFDRWPELKTELAATRLSSTEHQTLAWHVAEQLVGWFGVEQVEVYRGKEGLHVHSVDEIAAVVVAKLTLVWDALPEGEVDRLRRSGDLAQSLIHPWDKTD